MSKFSVTIAALVVCAGTAHAQCSVPSGSNEGKLLTFYSVPLVFSAATAPDPLMPGSIRFGFEGEYIPKPSAEIQRTGKCFLQKSEHTSLSPVFGRPRFTIGLPGRFAFEASYLPPVRIADAKPSLGSAALSRSQALSIPGRWPVTLMLRAHTTFGNVKGPITCPRKTLQTSNAAGACYGSTPSNDTFEPDMYGLDALLGMHPVGKMLSLYGGVGANRFDPHFRVGFTDGNGNVDNTKVQLDAPVTRVSLTLGFTAVTASRLDFGAQIYSVPQDVTTIRVHAGLGFR